MQLAKQIDQKAFDGLDPAIQGCYAKDAQGESFILSLKPFGDADGPKMADVLGCGRRRDAAAKVLHVQIVKDAVRAAGLPDQQFQDVLGATRCTIDEDGKAEVLVPDDRTMFRISEKLGTDEVFMNLGEYVEALKPGKPNTGSAGGAPAGNRTPDTIVEERKVGNDIVQRLASGRMLINGTPAEQLSGKRLMEIGGRPQRVTLPGPDVRLTAKQGDGLSGKMLMAVARGVLTPKQAAEQAKNERERRVK